MIAISMWQPWASLFLSPAKVHETRPWNMRHRGWLAIHAAQRRPRDMDIQPVLRSICVAHLGETWLGNVPYGALIGAVYIEDCLPTEKAAVGATDFHCGNYDPGRWAIRRGSYVKLSEPIPARGSQRYFYTSEQTDSEFREMIAALGLAA